MSLTPNYWLDADGDWTNVANWSLGAAPTNAHDVQILDGNKTITTNLPTDMNGIDYPSLTVSPNFEGKLGSSATPIYIGDVTELRLNANMAKELWIAVNTGDAVESTYIEDAGAAGSYNCHLYAGEFTMLHVQMAGLLRIGAGISVPKLVLPATGQRVHIVLDSGADIVDAWCVNPNSVVDCSTDFLDSSGAIYFKSGIWNHIGDTTFDINNLILLGGRFNFFSAGGTIQDLDHYDGVLDCDGGLGRHRVVETYTQFGGTRITRRRGQSVDWSSENIHGGSEILSGVENIGGGFSEFSPPAV